MLNVRYEGSFSAFRKFLEGLPCRCNNIPYKVLILYPEHHFVFQDTALIKSAVSVGEGGSIGPSLTEVNGEVLDDRAIL